MRTSIVILLIVLFLITGILAGLYIIPNLSQIISGTKASSSPESVFDSSSSQSPPQMPS